MGINTFFSSVLIYIAFSIHGLSDYNGLLAILFAISYLFLGWMIEKKFVIDLYGLTKGYRIISYFVLGITLLAISFVYQYFNKRLESMIHEKENQ